MSRSPARAAAWVVGPHSVFSVHEDGVLRQMILDPLMHNTNKECPLTMIIPGGEGEGEGGYWTSQEVEGGKGWGGGDVDPFRS